MTRYAIVRAPASITTTGRDYYYAWDNAPGLRLWDRTGFADGGSIEEVRTALLGCGRNPDEVLR